MTGWRILFTLLFLIAPLSAMAADGGETTVMADGSEEPGPTAPKECDWTELKKSLGYTESGGKYKITNRWNYLGKYQFGEARLNAIGWWSDPQIVDAGQCMSGGKRNNAKCETQCGPNDGKGYAACYNEFSGHWTGEAYSKFNIMSYQDFLNNGPAQERAFEIHMSKLYNETKHCHNAIGRSITDRKGRTCRVTMSGILAGGHLAGAGGVCNYLNNGGGAADNATHVSDYICTHKNIPVPIDGGQCSAEIPGEGRSPYDPGDQPDTDPEFCGAGCAGPTPEHYEQVRELIKYIWVAGLQLMAEQLTAVMMKQAHIVGALFDSKHQLETQRLLQQKAAQAHKDYHPSEQMCTVGTFARNLANSERTAALSKTALSQRGMQRDMMTGDSVATQGRRSDQLSRLQMFIETFCNPTDNAKGLTDLCKKMPDEEMINRDVDFTRTIDMPLTLAVDMLDADVTNDEKAVLALMDNLFLHKPPLVLRKEITTKDTFVVPYQDLRSLSAMRSAARNSFNSIIAQKSYGPKAEGADSGSNAPFLRALLKDMGISDEKEITALLGERPSYWAQMEVLTKKLYQNPNFTVNLYDKPANVTRMRAAMRAIKAMQDRDIYEALLRREMLFSILTELTIRREQDRISNSVRDLGNE